jgi:hypothetical protein
VRHHQVKNFRAHEEAAHAAFFILRPYLLAGVSGNISGYRQKPIMKFEKIINICLRAHLNFLNRSH